jgi:ferredoxin
MGQQYISQEGLHTFLKNLSGSHTVLVPERKGEARFYTPYEASSRSSLIVGEVRTVEPLKVFFFKARQKVAVGFQDNLPDSPEKPLCLVGVKACDLHGLHILDRVFTDSDYRDPFYEKARQDTLIISSDCTMALDTCYCLSFHNHPYPQEGFDINLSEVNGGYIVEDGSEKGAEMINQNASLFSSPDPQALTGREEQRQRVRQEVEETISQSHAPAKEELQGIIEKNYDAPIWEEEARNCVECAACNMICPTCHCFLLYDQHQDDTLARFRSWDSCMLKDFARVAGGANPREHLWMRLRNRFEKKFDFFPKVFEIVACTGCGRCISACPAKIDIRSVLKRLVDNVQKQ